MSVKSYFGLLTLLLIFHGTAHADLITYTTHADPKVGPDANRFFNGNPTGTVDLWSTSFSSGDSSKNGSFIGNSGNNGDGNGAGAGNPAWALYANDGNFASATASVIPDLGRTLSKKTEYISLDFDNGFIDFGASVGVRFRDSLNNIVSDLRFTGGDANYKIFDSVVGFDTGIGFTDDGFTVKLELENKTGGYSLTVGATTFAGRTLGSGANAIASVVVYNLTAGSFAQRDIYFNNFSISSIPEPSSMAVGALIAAGSGGMALRRRLGRSGRKAQS